MARKTTTRRKIKRGKIWFKVHAPKIFNENEIGETLGKDEQSIIGRTIKVPFSEISGDITKHNIVIKLKITKVTGEHAYTTIASYELSKPFLQRMIRRRTTKIEVVKDLRLKDGKKYRIKVVAVTLHRTSSSQQSALVKAIEKEIENSIPSQDIESLIASLSIGKLQREMQKKISKVYPLRFFDVRKVELLKEKKEVAKK
ncbi:MAG: hypothetical protein J7K73_01910 [Nanoarchaeota archaeon]|nr:hypothetical protein [Nanoarchaeota archaeon]